MDKPTWKKIVITVVLLPVAGRIANFVYQALLKEFKTQITEIAHEGKKVNEEIGTKISDGFTDMDDVLNGQAIILDNQKLILEKLELLGGPQ